MSALVLLLLALCAGAIGLHVGRKPSEKRDFTLILAYWQTIRDCRNHPDDVDPRKNPAFQPARNALKLTKLLVPSMLLLFSALVILCLR
ncbi:MAG: hypothetical protein Q4E13_13290 [Clostridia bacterium]|nr:hypothetical protein [Clostridia bacterium]